MNSILKTAGFILLCAFTFQCTSLKKKDFDTRQVYKSDKLIILQLAPNSYQHISYLKTNDFGNVPCNGLVVIDHKEAIIFDTPTDDKGSEELILWLTENQKCKIKAIIPTHFHDDCLGGLGIFEKYQIPSYANEKTIALAKENDSILPQNGFKDSLSLALGNEKVSVKFVGEGHTVDNVVGYFPKDEIMFGGCLIKELGATRGYLGDANLKAWSSTVLEVKAHYPKVKIVVPGHGDAGNQKLLDYTSRLFKPKE